jgi:bifunctional oligoribonuclease and PAP phosphatase NrnA
MGDNSKHVSFEELCAALKNIKTALITTHVSPDSDAIGSSCALQLGLEKAGISSFIYLVEEIPEYVSPLAASLVEQSKIINTFPLEPVDAFIIVDTAGVKRINGKQDIPKSVAKCFINIDHHASNEVFGDLNYIEANSPSTSCIVLKILERLEIEVDSQIANLLFAGLMDDTGCFRYSNTTNQAFLAAARLVECGASPNDVANILHFSTPERVLKLKAVALANLKTELSGKLAIIAITKAMVSEIGGRIEDAEGLVDLARSVQGAVAAVLIREGDDEWKVSLRSKIESLDVNKLAATFGGGGHKAASGCRMKGELSQIYSQLVQAFGLAI